MLYDTEARKAQKIIGDTVVRCMICIMLSSTLAWFIMSAKVNNTYFSSAIVMFKAMHDFELHSIFVHPSIALMEDLL